MKKFFIFLVFLTLTFSSCHRITEEEKTENISIKNLDDLIYDVDLNEYFSNDEIKAISIIYNKGQNKDLIFKIIQEEAMRKVVLSKIERECKELKRIADQANADLKEYERYNPNNDITKLYKIRCLTYTAKLIEAENIFGSAILADMSQRLKSIQLK